MSPGATFERVYRELRRMLADGELPPGSPIEPAVIGRQIASSITPVRDALHRLTGERLVEAPNHNGFRVPILTEAALRDLYSWNGQLVGFGIRSLRRPAIQQPAAVIGTQDDTAIAPAGLFEEIARTNGNAEYVRAIEQLNSRLAPFRRVEAKVLADNADEYSRLFQYWSLGDLASLRRFIEHYHRRRARAAPEILAARG